MLMWSYAKIAINLLFGGLEAGAEQLRRRTRLMASTILWLGLIYVMSLLTGAYGQAANHLYLSSATAHAEAAPGQPSAAIKALPGDASPPTTLAPSGTIRNGYAFGNCTWYVASRRPIPSGWGNAAGWLSHAVQADWGTGAIPRLGAIAWVGTGLGHVALVEDISNDGSRVYVAEMNYAGFDRIDHRWVASTAFRYIY